MNYPDIPLTPRVLLREEVYSLLGMYFPYRQVENAVNVCELESGFATHAWNNTGEDSRGLMQVNVQAWPQYSRFNLWDPQVNAWCAYQIYQLQGWRAWYNSAKQLRLI